MGGKNSGNSFKPTEIERRYQRGFMARMDGRCSAVRVLKNRLAEMHNDLGGEESLSYFQRSLCERGLHLEQLLKLTEEKLRDGHQIETGSYIQGVNALQGVWKTLGLRRQARDVTVTLAEYLEQRYEAEQSDDDE